MELPVNFPPFYLEAPLAGLLKTKPLDEQSESEIQDLVLKMRLAREGRVRSKEKKEEKE